jgi:DNA-binding transcriptional LysR family regulator
MHVILKLLEQNAGISFMYQMAAQKRIQQNILRSIPLKGLPVQHELSLVWKRGSQYSKEYKNLCQDFSKE